MDSIEELVTKQFAEIPDELQRHVTSSALQENINEVLKSHPLQQVQINAFGLEVLMVLLQLESIEAFTVNIKHSMEISLKRAEEISHKTKQIIFLPVQDMLIQSAYIESADGPSAQTDGIQSARNTAEEIPLQDIPEPPKKGAIHNEMPTAKPNHPIVAPVKVSPSFNEADIPDPPSAPVPDISQEPSPMDKLAHPPNIDSLDIFKKRLQEPVHSPVAEQVVGEGERKVENTDPSSHDQISKDPYKETIE